MNKSKAFLEEHKVSFDDNTLKMDGDIISIQEYTFLEILSNGANAIVMKAKNNLVDELVAIKIYKKSNVNAISTKDKNEIKKLSYLSNNKYSRHIVKYNTSGSIKDHCYCVMELLKEEYITLEKWLDSHKKAKNVFSDRILVLENIISGLRFAHDNKIYHGDLHTKNVLINPQTREIKIIDFGSSFKNKSYSKKRDNDLMLKLIKTILYDEKIKELLYFEDVNIDIVPQNCIRLIIKSYSKLLTLLNFWENSNIDTIYIDIASFITLVPVYNIDVIEKYMFNEKNNDLLIAFRNILMVNTIKKLEHYLYYISKHIMENNVMSNIIKENNSFINSYLNKGREYFQTLPYIDLYSVLRKSFIIFCDLYPQEKYIYSNLVECKNFNSLLYFYKINEDTEELHLQEYDENIY